MAVNSGNEFLTAILGNRRDRKGWLIISGEKLSCSEKSGADLKEVDITSAGNFTTRNVLFGIGKSIEDLF